MFPTIGRGNRKGQTVLRWWRIHPIARKPGIPNRFVTFQVRMPAIPPPEPPLNVNFCVSVLDWKKRTPL